MSGAKRAPSSSVKNADGERPVRARCRPSCSGLDHLEPGEHAEVAVVAAAGAHGVDVGAAHHRRAIGPRRRRRRSTLPMPSIVTSSPRSRIQATTRSRPARSSSVSASRAHPSVPSMAPISASAASAAEQADRCRCATRAARGHHQNDTRRSLQNVQTASTGAVRCRAWPGSRRRGRSPRSSSSSRSSKAHPART